jgi:hypothetical protein
MPERLDDAELADWRAGRNAVYQLAALTIGASRGRRRIRCKIERKPNSRAAEQSAAPPSPNSGGLARSERFVLSHFSPFVFATLAPNKFAAEGNPWRRGGEAELRSGFAENPGDLSNGNPVDLGDLATRQAVF